MASVKCFKCKTEFYGFVCPQCGTDRRNVIEQQLSAAGAESMSARGQHQRDVSNSVAPPQRRLNERIGQYEVLNKIDQGAFGAVYKACDIHLDKPVAIKALHLEDPSAMKDEARALSELGHENIVGFRHLFLEDGCWYLVMEYVDGASLRKWLDTGILYEGGANEALKRILSFSLQFAEGLAYAHGRGVIHRDVKPGNVLVTSGGLVKVSDFGLAKARAVAQSSVTNNARESILVSVGGMTPAYCSPEQHRREGLTSKTDVWSWALSVFEMFNGGVTWQHGTAAPEVVRGYLAEGILSKQKESRGDCVPRLPGELANLLMRCFHTDYRERPTMSEAVTFLKVMDSTVSHKPLLADVGVARTADEKAAVIRAFQAGERFAVIGNDTIIDTKTNLMWARASSDSLDYSDAKSYARKYSGGGYRDWRLPTPQELTSLYEAMKGLSLFKLKSSYGYIWSSKAHFTIAPIMYEVDCLSVSYGGISGQKRSDKSLTMALPVRSSS